MTNNALAPLEFLIGRWRVAMTHHALPETLEWQDTFEWLADSFIGWRSEGRDQVPAGISVIGRNEWSSLHHALSRQSGSIAASRHVAPSCDVEVLAIVARFRAALRGSGPRRREVHPRRGVGIR